MLLIWSVTLIGTLPAFAQTARLTGVGTAPNYAQSAVTAVSASGVVTGYVYNGSTANALAFRWTGAGGLQLLGVVGTSTASVAAGISADGNTVVGGLWNGTYGSDRPFVWSAAGGMTQLGVSSGYAADANGVSADGSRVLLSTYSPTTSSSWVSVWSGSSSITIPMPAGATSGGQGWAISADGTTVVGQYTIRGGALNAAFRWTQQGGAQTIPGLDYGFGYSHSAVAVSADGRAVAGSVQKFTNPTSPTTPYLWTEGGGLRSLGLLPGAGWGESVALSPTAAWSAGSTISVAITGRSCSTRQASAT